MNLPAIGWKTLKRYGPRICSGKDVCALSPVIIYLLQGIPARHGVKQDALSPGDVKASINYLVRKFRIKGTVYGLCDLVLMAFHFIYAIDQVVQVTLEHAANIACLLLLFEIDTPNIVEDNSGDCYFLLGIVDDVVCQGLWFQGACNEWVGQCSLYRP